jgi:hypothetical protein
LRANSGAIEPIANMVLTSTLIILPHICDEMKLETYPSCVIEALLLLALKTSM